MITVEFIFVMDHTVKECNDNIIVIFRLHDDKDEPSMPTLASVRLIHNIPELKVCQEVWKCEYALCFLNYEAKIT